MFSKDYHDYVIKGGKFIGKFEEMYQNIEDPWLHGKALALHYNIALEILEKAGDLNKNKNVLDIGCGKGAFTDRLGKLFKNAKISALDISETAIKKAKKQNKNPKIKFKVSDIQKDYKNIKGRFDLVVMSDIMWYVLPDLKNILEYISESIFKKNSRLLIIQAFYKGTQKYGNEFVQTPEDFIKLSGLELVNRIDVHKEKDFESIMLLKK